MRARIPGVGVVIASVVAVLVALVLSHSLVFLVRFGSAYGEALAHAGHGPAWTAAVGGSLASGAALLGVAVLGLYRLRQRARQLGAGGRRGEPTLRAFLRSWATVAVRLLSATSLLLTFQENIERVYAGLAGPNPALLLSAEYPFALAIVAGVSVVVAFVFALVRWRRAALEQRMRAARRLQIRVASVRRPDAVLGRTPQAVVAGRLAVRAPPNLEPAFPA